MHLHSSTSCTHKVSAPIQLSLASPLIMWSLPRAAVAAHDPGVAEAS